MTKEIVCFCKMQAISVRCSSNKNCLPYGRRADCRKSPAHAGLFRQSGPMQGQFPASVFSYGVEQYGEELQHAAKDHENVEYRVHPPFLRADAVEHRAHGVGDAAEEQQQKARLGEHLVGLHHKGKNGPPKADIADHGQHIVLLQIDGGEGGGDGGHDPLKDEQTPADFRVHRADGGKGHDGVGAGDEKIDGAVVHHLHHLLAHAGLHAVVHAGHGVQGHHAHAVNGRGHDAVDIVAQGCKYHAQHQGRDGQAAAHNVGDGVHPFFAPGVVGQHPVAELGSFHKRSSWD